jgi:hypothetical protein
MSAGWDIRLKSLKNEAEQKMLTPLRKHNWTVHSVEEFEDGEYLIIDVERGGQRHKVALLYTSATGNAVYKKLVSQVEHIFLCSPKYMLESYAYGIETPIDILDDFHDLLVRWNEASAPGKFAPESPSPLAAAKKPEYRHLLAEAPIDAIWLRLRQLTSVTLASKLVSARASANGVSLDASVTRSKAEGVSFSLRNAIDYFQAAGARNVSQRVLNLYYGSMAFVFAEMLAGPKGAVALAEIEDATRFGHGLYTIDGEGGSLDHLVVGINANGLFPKWMQFLEMPTKELPTKKPRVYADLAGLPAWTWITVEQLFARIPEVADLYAEIFDSSPGWVHADYDILDNKLPSFRTGERTRPSRSYIHLTDETGRLVKENIAELQGPLSEIVQIPSDEPGCHFRVGVNHADVEPWAEAVPIHSSPFVRQALIMPLYGNITQFRAICVVLLYALSIVVRYRPSIWRRVQEGDLDHMRALIEAFLAVVERVLPEQFLEQVTGQPVIVAQPGSLYG